MLPTAFLPSGAYRSSTIDKARGYRLLVHAEIEAFLEEAARNLAVAQVRAWKLTRKATDTLVCFLAFYHTGWVDDDSDPVNPPVSRPKVKDHVNEVVDIAIRQYLAIISSNHGIRRDNLKKLLWPIGIRPEDLDEAWLIEMDQYGKYRGEVAHQSFKTHQPIDPRTELDTVGRLVIGLETVDELLEKMSA